MQRRWCCGLGINGAVEVEFCAVPFASQSGSSATSNGWPNVRLQRREHSANHTDSLPGGAGSNICAQPRCRKSQSFRRGGFGTCIRSATRANGADDCATVMSSSWVFRTYERAEKGRASQPSTASDIDGHTIYDRRLASNLAMAFHTVASSVLDPGNHPRLSRGRLRITRQDTIPDHTNLGRRPSIDHWTDLPDGWQVPHEYPHPRLKAVSGLPRTLPLDSGGMRAGFEVGDPHHQPDAHGNEYGMLAAMSSKMRVGHLPSRRLPSRHLPSRHLPINWSILCFR